MKLRQIKSRLSSFFYHFQSGLIAIKLFSSDNHTLADKLERLSLPDTSSPAARPRRRCSSHTQTGQGLPGQSPASPILLGPLPNFLQAPLWPPANFPLAYSWPPPKCLLALLWHFTSRTLPIDTASSSSAHSSSTYLNCWENY